jgi:hypothetical protein
MNLLVWLLVLVVAAVLLDRGLLLLESRGWINYRRTGLSRGAALYHTFELQRIFTPGIQSVIEIHYGERRQEDDAGDPPVTLESDEVSLPEP